MLSEMQRTTEYVMQMEEKVYKSNKISLELLKQLKDAEVEIETLKSYIVDLKAKVPDNYYLPLKNDVIDRRLADYINKSSDRSNLK